MVARTLPFKSRDKPQPREPLPSVPPDRMENKQSVADELRHAKEQIALTQQYPGRSRAYPGRFSPLGPSRGRRALLQVHKISELSPDSPYPWHKSGQPAQGPRRRSAPAWARRPHKKPRRKAGARIMTHSHKASPGRPSMSTHLI